MERSWETVTIRYYSGYIRNWRRLGEELGVAQDLGREDREAAILRRGYARWGAALPDHLRGMFALVLWDEGAKRLYAVRDQVGQKQLFYAETGDEPLCSGDIDEIAADPRVGKRLDRGTLQRYLFYGYPIGEDTFYQGIKKLPAGHFLLWEGGRATVRRYWRPVFEPQEGRSAEDWAQEIREVIGTILAEEREDPALPYKESFLSGGVDSSYLLAASDAAFANTVGYQEPGFDESPLAEETAALLGRGLRIKTIRPREYFDQIPLVMDKLGQPLGDASAVAFSLGCAAAAEHAKVIYSGEGVDEFFGGYNAHRRSLPAGAPYLTCSRVMPEELVRRLLLDADEAQDDAQLAVSRWEETQGMDEFSRKLAVDISLWLDGDIYLNTDRTSAARGVELHTPLSDLRFFDVARRVPANMKLREGQNKYVFRLAAAGFLPDRVAFREKVGFAVPIRRWMADGRFRGEIEGTLFGETSRRFFRQEVLREIWAAYLDGQDALWNRLYAIYAFLVWHGLKFS